MRKIVTNILLVMNDLTVNSESVQAQEEDKARASTISAKSEKSRVMRINLS